MLIDAIAMLFCFQAIICTLLEDTSHLNAWSVRRLVVNILDVSEVTIDTVFSLTIRQIDKVFVIDDHPYLSYFILILNQNKAMNCSF